MRTSIKAATLAFTVGVATIGAIVVSSPAFAPASGYSVARNGGGSECPECPSEGDGTANAGATTWDFNLTYDSGHPVR